MVIGAGWCRTGTSSLQVALEALGFAPCFHSRLLPYLPGVRDACYEHSRSGARKFPVERVFGRYRAAVDLPAALIPLLLDAYPDAKVPSSSLAVVTVLKLCSADASCCYIHLQGTCADAQTRVISLSTWKKTLC